MLPHPPHLLTVSVFLVGLLVLAGCRFERTYEVRGRVVGFSNDPRTVIVEHEDVPGYMPAMTMPFTARSAGEVARLERGEAVAFTLEVGRDSARIYDVQSLPNGALARHPAGEPPRRTAADSSGVPILQAGDRVLPFRLVSQNGDTLRFSEYAGQAVALTFIYTRCPIPDYCPLMSERFAALAPRLNERFGDQAALLSISFDPEYDTPNVLRDYAARYTDAAGETWTFATGDPEQIERATQMFGVFQEASPEGEEIMHSLTTAVIGPDGRVERIWRGNDWSTDDIVRALENALQSSPS